MEDEGAEGGHDDHVEGVEGGGEDRAFLVHDNTLHIICYSRTHYPLHHPFTLPLLSSHYIFIPPTLLK